MRDPEHRYIQIVATGDLADEIERRFAPHFTLALLPEDAQGQDDLPCYVLAVTEVGMQAARFAAMGVIT